MYEYWTIFDTFLGVEIFEKQNWAICQSLISMYFFLSSYFDEPKENLERNARHTIVVKANNILVQGFANQNQFQVTNLK